MELHISLAAETLFHIGPIPVTNSMLTMFIVMAVVLLVFSVVARKAQAVPGRGQGLIEMIVEFIMGLVEGAAGRKFGRTVLPLVSGIFIFIIFSNFSGLLPGMGTIGVYREESEEHAETTVVATPAAEHGADEHVVADATAVAATTGTDHEGTDSGATAEGEHALTEDHEATHEVLVPFFRAPTADLNMTLALSLLTFTMVQIYGIKAHGVRGRIKHMANPPFIFPIEVISELSRILSLSARLFGNVFAGEVLLGVMYAMAAAIKIAIIPFLFPVIFLFLEVMFGTIQALVFALLTTIYITLAAADAHGDEHAEDHSHGHDAASDHPKVAASGAGD
ncbi:MAG: F0F1 ATP synthase subunit A [Thermomicrobiales bacterium]